MNILFRNKTLANLLALFAMGGIVLTYLLQDFSFLNTWIVSDTHRFVIRKILRILLNDFFMLVFIVAWFRDWRFARLAIAIQLFDGLILLPAYLFIKLTVEGSSEISTPLLSQFHRLIINPTLMILLVPAIYFQRFSRQG